MGNIILFSGKTVPFLRLWYDVIEGSPHPNSTAIHGPYQGVLVVPRVLVGSGKYIASEA